MMPNRFNAVFNKMFDICTRIFRKETLKKEVLSVEYVTTPVVAP